MLVRLTTPFANESTFVPFVAVAFFAWRVPETSGRSLEEIEHDLGVSKTDREPHPAVA